MSSAGTPASEASAAAPASSSPDVRGLRRRRGPAVWCAVVGSIAFAGFLSLFSLEPPVTLIGLAMQNIPTLVMLIGAALAWRLSWMGAAWLAAAALASVFVFATWRSWDTLLLISAPPMALAALLIIDAVRRR